MTNPEFTDRRLVDRGVEACQDNTAVRMGFIETRLTEHTKILEQNAALSTCLNERFDNFETELKVERRSKDAELAKALDTWKGFTITKFDESAARQEIIESNQTLHMKSTETLQAGIGSVLEIVTALSGAKKTLGWLGKGGLWIGGLALAWTGFKTALMSPVKIQWPW